MALHDSPENILKRISFYDIDSQPIEKDLTSEEKRLYLREIKKAITYYRKAYQRADAQVDISGLDADAAVRKVREVVEVMGGKFNPRRIPAPVRLLSK